MFCEHSQQLSSINVFAKDSMLDVWQGSEYASDQPIDVKIGLSKTQCTLGLQRYWWDFKWFVLFRDVENKIIK